MVMIMELELVIRLTPDDYDSNHVHWEADGKRLGGGYQSKKDDRLHVTRCPMCGRENYALMVAHGFCAFCGFDPNA